MKRMVKNGDLFDISKDGSATFKGNLKVGGTIIANGEIRGGDVSAGKFYLGTEEMPLVKANPAGEATETLEKVKIGNVAYNVGGGGGSSDRELTLTATVDSSTTNDIKIYVDEDIWNKVKECYYDTMKIYYSDGNPLGIFHVLKYNQNGFNSAFYGHILESRSSNSYSAWFGSTEYYRYFLKVDASYDNKGKYIRFIYINEIGIPDLDQSKFDALYKLADKPTQDGTYVLKATVSGGAVTYTWEPQA